MAVIGVREDSRPKEGSRRVAQLVAQELLRTFHGATGSHSLNVYLREDTATLAVRRDATELRLQLKVFADVELLGPGGDVIFTAPLSASAPYNVEDTPYSTDAGRERARISAVKTLSDDIVHRIAFFLHQTGSEPALEGKTAADQGQSS